MKKLKIVFPALWAEHLSISLLAAIAKKQGYDVKVAFAAYIFNDRYFEPHGLLAKRYDDSFNIIRIINEEKPDVVAFSAVTSNYLVLLDIAKKTKQLLPNVKVIFGGVHPSAVPEVVIKNQEIDFVVIGEGEIAFLEILHSIERNDYFNTINNVWYRNNAGNVIKGIQSGFIQDLDSLPFFDKSIWEDYLNVGDLYTTMASRGCPNKCSYCFNNYFRNIPQEPKGKYVRSRSVWHLIEELKIAKERHNLKAIDFYDDIFTMHKSWLKDFAEKFKKEIHVPYHIFTHPLYMDDEIANLLHESGCEWAQIGIQSINEDYKKEYLLRNESIEQSEKALNSLHRFGIKTKVDFIFDLPMEPANSCENARMFFSRNTPKTIETYWACYLPGTDLIKIGLDCGVLTNEDVININEGKEIHFFRKTKNKVSSILQKDYQVYNFIFKILPMMPLFLRKYIKKIWFQWLPLRLITKLGYFFDLFNAFVQKDVRLRAHIRHTFFQMKRIRNLKKMDNL